MGGEGKFQATKGSPRISFIHLQPLSDHARPPFLKSRSSRPALVFAPLGWSFRCWMRSLVTFNCFINPPYRDRSDSFLLSPSKKVQGYIAGGVFYLNFFSNGRSLVPKVVAWRQGHQGHHWNQQDNTLCLRGCPCLSCTECTLKIECRTLSNGRNCSSFLLQRAFFRHQKATTEGKTGHVCRGVLGRLLRISSVGEGAASKGHKK